MTDPTINQINSISQIDTTSDVAGGAAVNPAYIASDVPVTPNIEESVGIDSIEVSNGVSTSQINLGGTVEKEESANYIQSDTEEQVIISSLMDADNMDMNSIEEIEKASQYIAPDDTAVQVLLMNLKSFGIITDSMSQDEMVMAIHDYVTANFSYQVEAAGDDWQTVSETIKNGGGDCEDLANLEASLLTAALVDKGINLEDAEKRVCAVVVANINTGTGHVYVSYVKEDGTTVNLDPSVKDSSAFGLTPESQMVLFSYTAGAVNVKDISFANINFMTAGYIIPSDPINSLYGIEQIKESEIRLDEIQLDLAEILACTSVLSAQTEVDARRVDLALAQQTLNTATTPYNNYEEWATVDGGCSWVKMPASSWDSTLAYETGDPDYYKNHDDDWIYANSSYECGLLDTLGIIRTYHTALDDFNVKQAAYDAALVKYINVAYKNGYISDPSLVTNYSLTQYYVQTRENIWGSTTTTEITYSQYMDLLPRIFDMYDYDGDGHNEWIRGVSTQTTTSTQIKETYLDGIVNSFSLSLKYRDTPTSLPTDHNTTVGYFKDHNLFEVDHQTYTVDSVTYNVDYYKLPDPGATSTSSAYVLNNYRVEILDIKGLMMVVALIYEAKRDLRNLVNQELRGAEETGYQGMDIPKLVQKKVSRLEKGFADIVANCLKIVNNMNQAAYTQLQISINDEYNRRKERIEDRSDGIEDFFKDEYWNSDIRELQNERNRLQALSGAASQFQTITQQNLQAAQNTFVAMGRAAGMNLNSIVTQMNTLDRATLDTTDNGNYREMNYDLAVALRKAIFGAGQQVRIGLMGKETMATMRNLVHQEMTGIGGRQMRTDITSALHESEQNAILTWFDHSVELVAQRIQLENQQVYYDINIRKIRDQVNQMRNTQWAHYVSRAIDAVAMVVGVVLACIPGVGWVAGLVVSAILSILSQAFEGTRNWANALMARHFEQTYNDVIRPTAYNYQERGSGSFARTGDSDSITDMAADAELDAEEEAGDMTADNYLDEQNNGHDSPSNDLTRIWRGDFHSFGGSYAFDGVEFAAAFDRISRAQRVVMELNGIREAMVEMRNMVHMEMTGIGGRSPSNILTYAMEAARGQMSFIANLSSMSIKDVQQSRNLQYDRNRRLLQASQAAASAYIGMQTAIIPWVGGTLSSQFGMYNQRRNFMEQDHASFTTDSTYEFEFDALNNLIDSGTTSIGDGEIGVNYNTVSQARTDVTKAIIARAVLSSIKKAKADMRSLVHMEMTGIKSFSSDLASQINTVDFEAAMRSIDLITDYLSENCRVHNEALDASRMVAKLTRQISNNWVKMVLSVASKFGGTVGGVAGAILNAALTVGSAFIQFDQAKREYKWASDRAKDDTGDLRALIAARKIMEQTPTSTESRLAQLEAEVMQNLGEDMMQSLGYGNVGVNAGLGAKYKALLERAYRRDKAVQTIKETLVELRNTVHSVMTGIGGLTSDSTSQALTATLESAKAKIDDAFKLLQSLADRKNEIAQAERQKVKAKAELTKATVNLIIQSVIAAISLVMTAIQIASRNNAKNAESNQENAQKDVNNAKAELKSAQDQNDPAGMKAAADKVQVTEGALKQANANLKVAEAKLESVTSFSNSVNTGITCTSMAVNLTMILDSKSQLEAGEREINAKASDYVSEVSRGRDSRAQALEGAMSGEGSLEDMAAASETEVGRTQMMKNANANKYNMNEIKRESKQEIEEWAKGAIKEIAKYRVEKQKEAEEKKLMVPPTNNDQASESTSSVSSPAGTKPVKGAKASPVMDLSEASKAMMEATKNLKANPNSPAALEAAKVAINNFKQATKANTSAALDYAKSILSRMEEATETRSAPQVETPTPTEGEEKVSTEDLKKAYEAAKKDLKKAQDALREALAAVKDLKNKVPEAEKAAVAAMESVLEEEQKKLESIIEIEGNIDDLDKMLAGQKDEKLKGVISKQREGLVRSLTEIQSSLEDSALTRVAAEVNTNMAKEELEAASKEVKASRQNVDKLKNRVALLVKALAQADRQASKMSVGLMGKGSFGGNISFGNGISASAGLLSQQQADSLGIGNNPAVPVLH